MRLLPYKLLQLDRIHFAQNIVLPTGVINKSIRTRDIALPN